MGGKEFIPLDVRLVTATHQDPEAMIAEGRFREDLYYRLNVVPLPVPPLRERRDDIPLLVQHFLRQAQERYCKAAKQVTGQAMRLLSDYAWPGNVRQLRNCIERLTVTIEGSTIHAEDLPENLRAATLQGVVTLEQATQRAEKAAILAALAQCSQHRERAASLLDVSVRTLHYKMNRYDLQ